MKITFTKPTAECNHIGSRDRIPFFTEQNTLYVDRQWYEQWPTFRSTLENFQCVPIEIEYPNNRYTDLKGRDEFVFFQSSSYNSYIYLFILKSLQ